jgi:biopolymer transport protein ExbB/TolQ
MTAFIRSLFPALALALALALSLSLSLGGALAADKPAPSADNAYAAAKSAEIETLKARASLNPSAGATSILMEADDQLRRFRQASAAEKASLRAQLDATLARAELELSRGR